MDTSEPRSLLRHKSSRIVYFRKKPFFNYENEASTAHINNIQPLGCSNSRDHTVYFLVGPLEEFVIEYCIIVYHKRDRPVRGRIAGLQAPVLERWIPGTRTEPLATMHPHRLGRYMA